jgi:hypothetical protein
MVPIWAVAAAQHEAVEKTISLPSMLTARQVAGPANPARRV